MVNIQGLDKAEVLAALYNDSRPIGMGVLHHTPGDMKKEEASELLKGGTYFDYVKGRVMKVDLSGDEFSPHLYDRDNGNGAAHRAVQKVRKLD